MGLSSFFYALVKESCGKWTWSTRRDHHEPTHGVETIAISCRSCTSPSKILHGYEEVIETIVSSTYESLEITQEATNDGMDRQSVEHGRLSRSSIPVEKRGLDSNRSSGCTSRCMLLHSRRGRRSFLHPYVLLLTNRSFPLGSCHTRSLVTNGRPCPLCRFLVVPHHIPTHPCLALHPIALHPIALHCIPLPCTCTSWSHSTSGWRDGR